MYFDRERIQTGGAKSDKGFSWEDRGSRSRFTEQTESTQINRQSCKRKVVPFRTDFVQLPT